MDLCYFFRLYLLSQKTNYKPDATFFFEGKITYSGSLVVALLVHNVATKGDKCRARSFGGFRGRWMPRANSVNDSVISNWSLACGNRMYCMQAWSKYTLARAVLWVHVHVSSVITKFYVFPSVSALCISEQTVTPPAFCCETNSVSARCRDEYFKRNYVQPSYLSVEHPVHFQLKQTKYQETVPLVGFGYESLNRFNRLKL